ncbi:MAG: 50S ribosomal protein L15 [Thermodesulfobacteriota bacterium]|nr:50S ribosomal protein L15 [Thermodesulfobacteriota bacterium]
MDLSQLSPPSGSRKAKRRVGRGPGSGRGTTAGRGTKGHNSRSGGGVRPGFEGGQMPLHRRLPKRGFNNIFAKRLTVVNIRDLEKFEGGSVVDEAALRANGIVKNAGAGIKLLGQGEIDRPLTVKVNKASKSARSKIEAAGGTMEADN